MSQLSKELDAVVSFRMRPLSSPYNCVWLHAR
ncbi:hypothetical protein AMOR_18480 [Anaeromyxobacter oryzae]|uniref:Uncharacterized protein n=1 Tax=Anaeromyxobacter oryzae TaxID=2918170 RepID=A0ABM7WTN0_9BACT|nr:hypothetical protein AMOR_18480 [Anaeromyxobacter oryzae]